MTMIGGNSLKENSTEICVIVNNVPTVLGLSDGGISNKWTIGETWSYHLTDINAGSSIAIEVIDDPSSSTVVYSATLQ